MLSRNVKIPVAEANTIARHSGIRIGNSRLMINGQYPVIEKDGYIFNKDDLCEIVLSDASTAYVCCTKIDTIKSTRMCHKPLSFSGHSLFVKNHVTF